MSTKVAELAVRITGDGSSASRALDQVGSKSSSFASKASKAGAVAGKVLAGGLALAGVAAYKATQAAAADEAAQSKLAQTLAKAGGATREQIAATEDWITAQGKSKGISDDELRPSLAKLVAVTKDVGEAQKLSSLAMDIAAARGISLEAATKSLAKAQTDGAAGLSRLGVNVKNAAGETVSLDVAQKRLAATYGGAAAKAAETTAGKQKILAVQMGELQEQIGQKLLPVMLKLADVGLKVIDWISRNTTLVGILIGVLASLLAITYAVGVAVKLYTTYTKVATAAQWLWNAALAANPIGFVVLAIAALVGGFIIAYKTSDKFRAVVDRAFAAVKRVVLGAVSFVVGFVRSHWRLLLAILTGPIGIAVLLIARHWDRIKAGAAAAWSKVKDIVHAGVVFVPNLLRSSWSALAGIAGAVWDNVRSRVASAVGRVTTAVREGISRVLTFYRELPGRILNALGDLGQLLYHAGVDIIQGLLDGITDKFHDVEDKFHDITSKIPDIKGPPSRDKRLLRGAGELVMQGLLDGIDVGDRKLTAKLKQITAKIRTGVQASTAKPISLDAGTSSAIASAGGSRVAYIVIQGAVDRVGTARQVRELLKAEATWNGRIVQVAG